MDKNYENQPSTNNGATQFFVVPNSGTLVAVNDKQIQYITQVENLKENGGGVQPNIVYDVTPQQYYVNKDNTPKHMSVLDQFIIPDGKNNINTNNYQLPTAENNKVEQTDYVLDDDQCRLYEQQGWTLIEGPKKTYLVDTLGLHDITEDKKLIAKLKRDANVSEESSNIVNDEVSYENEGPLASNSIEEPIDYSIKDVKKQDVKHKDVIQQNQDVQSYLDNNPDPVQPQEIVEEHTHDIAYLAAKNDYVKVTSFQDTSYRREGEALRIKTKFCFEDIPPEIVLGRTEHGKKFVARAKLTKL